MKICQLINKIHRDDTRVYHKEAATLAMSGHDVVIVTDDGMGDAVEEWARIKTIRRDPIIGRVPLLGTLWCYARAAIAEKADVYILHEPLLLPLVMILAGRRRRVLFDCHEDFPRLILEKEYLPKWSRKLIASIAKTVYGLLLPRFDWVFSVTPEIVSRLGHYTKSVSLVTNYPIASAADGIRRDQADMIEDFKLCYFGTVYRSSLQENILAAIKDLDGASYHIIGVIESEYLSELQKKDGWERARFTPRVKQKAVWDIMGAMSVGMAIFDYSPNLGYRKGSLGVNKIFEYMLAGLPVICTDFEVWREIVRPENTGICVNPHDIGEIRDALVFLKSNPGIAVEMGHRGRNLVRKKYTWDSQAHEFVSKVLGLP